MNAQDLPTRYCDEYYGLLYDYFIEIVHLKRHEPNQVAQARAALITHRKTCQECQDHMHSMTAFATTTTHPEFKTAK